MCHYFEIVHTYLLFWVFSFNLHLDSVGDKLTFECVCLCLYSLYQDGSGRQCLLIERVMKSDAGWYTLSAINEAGMSTCNARLDVGCKSSCVFLLPCKWSLKNLCWSVERDNLVVTIVARAVKIKQQMENVRHSMLDWIQLCSLEHVKQMLRYVIKRKVDELFGLPKEYCIITKSER